MGRHVPHVTDVTSLVPTVWQDEVGPCRLLAGSAHAVEVRRGGPREVMRLPDRATSHATTMNGERVRQDSHLEG